jgi:protoporphyrinogen oxidase
MNAGIAVVGGGLAGLATAYHLRDLSPIVLESTDRCGGRVLSATDRGVTYDLGAAIGYQPDWLPFGVAESTLIEEEGPIGLFVGGQLIQGMSPRDCIARALDGRIEGPEFDTQALARAFFRVIHPGEPEDYSRVVRQRDSLHRFSAVHRVGGNGELVRAFEERLSGSILLSTPVTELNDEGQRVTVVARGDDKDLVITARAAVVATTASIALRILPGMPETVRGFLEGVRYAPYIVVALGIRASLPCVSYVVTPEGPMDVISLQHTIDDGFRVVLCYFGARSASWAASLSDEDIIANVIAVLGKALSDHTIEQSLAFHRVQRWNEGASVISPALAAPRSTIAMRCGSRVVLAGDYLSAPYPYGMEAALRSGKAASESIRAILGSS